MSTLNLQVGASGDDAFIDGSAIYPTSSVIAAGSVFANYESAARFTGATGIAGATINSALYRIYGVTGAGSTIRTKVRAERADAPAAPTTRGDFLGRTLTTAGIDFDSTLTVGSYNDIDITTVIQELADNQSSTVVQVFHKNDGSSDANVIQAVAYDGTAGNAAKLDIDYAAPSAGIRRNLLLLGCGT